MEIRVKLSIVKMTRAGKLVELFGIRNMLIVMSKWKKSLTLGKGQTKINVWFLYGARQTTR